MRAVSGQGEPERAREERAEVDLADVSCPQPGPLREATPSQQNGYCRRELLENSSNSIGLLALFFFLKETRTSHVFFALVFSVSVFLCPSISLCLCICLSVSLSLYLSFSLSLFSCLFLSPKNIYLLMSASHSVFLSIHLCINPSLSSAFFF